MGGGPKASAANLEPLGKRRHFQTPASSSEPKPSASLTRNVRGKETDSTSSRIANSRSALLSSTAGTATDPTESKDNAASGSVNSTAYNLLHDSRPPPTIEATSDHNGDESSERHSDAESANQVKIPLCRVPSPQTRLETSTRALALAQEWQAKFKALPKRPPMPDSKKGIDTRKQTARAENDQYILKHRQPQPTLYHNEELGALEGDAADKADEEPSRKRRRKSGPGPQASAVNLEPLGKRRKGFTPKVLADGTSTSTELRQKFSLEAAVDKPATVVHKPQLDPAPKTTDPSELKQHIRLSDAISTQASYGPAIGSQASPLMVRDTVVALQQPTPETEDGRREAEEKSDRLIISRNDQVRHPATNGKFGNDTRCEGTTRTHKRSSSPQRLRERYDNAFHRDGRDHKSDSMVIVPIEAFLFRRGLPKGRISMDEIIPLHLAGPTATGRTAATIIDTVASAVIAKKKSQAHILTVSAPLGVNMKALSIEAVIRNIRAMKDFNQLNMAIMSTIAASDHDHLEDIVILRTDSAIAVIA
ncbi:uncharacterized protein N0V89_008826 [Didymosphaeria variabile]|uniref:Uncharacterized protein n=1 Tax=Didymosphaeria variabile TaxID=1932322 RepID=A0A9W8XGN3_9PLEO|nr:uncharacterized protein N0V89_008826 [Didymosphaeria variabile]KAJ4350205.1 hypothetical protein N0V89_008826 [Didymosphaeria variabile]